jgi:signal transduction histidine kinase
VISLLAFVAVGLRWRRWSPGQRLRFAPAVVLGFLLLAINVSIQFTRDDRLVNDLFAAEQVVTALVAMAFLAGFASDLAGRLSARRLVMDAGASSADLDAALIHALRDPMVEVTTTTGPAAVVPSRQRAIELRLGDKPVGTLLVDDAIDHDPDLLATAGQLAALVLDRERLATETQAHLVEVQASRARIVKAVDDERRRIERNLHDGAQQRFLGIALRLSRVRDRQTDPAIVNELSTAIDESRAALDELRGLARGLHPVVLAEAGLEAAVHDLASRASVPPTLTSSDLDGQPIPPAIEAASYYVASEALANIAKHAHASAVTVRLCLSHDVFTVEVRDDGQGGAQVTAGGGLVGLDDRVATAGGTLTVASLTGHGTTVTAQFPLEGPRE